MVSVVIPTLEEEQRLPGCLAALVPQAQSVGAEILVVDGGSEDATVAVARATAGVRAIRGPRGRGSQMNAGARSARGSLLLFLPADTVLPEGALAALAAADAAGVPLAGGFRQRFDSPRRLLRVVSALHNLRARTTRVFYGDQAPFVRRELFLEMRGFAEGADLEDVEFGSRLKRRTRPEMLALTVVTSARRFDAAGDLRATVEAGRLLLLWTFFRRVGRSATFFTPVR